MKRMKRCPALFWQLVISVMIVPQLLAADFGPGKVTANWNQFRGPNGSGVDETSIPPITIAPAEASWRTPLPPGHSSPVIWGDQLFVTGVDGNRLVTLAFHTRSGNLLWRRSAPETPLERVHDATSAAASTPCVDQDGVYVYFGSYGLLCYNHAGRERWRRPVFTPQSMYGVATSPILHEHLLILVRDDDADLSGSPLSQSSVMALDRLTGETIWVTPRPYNRGAWATPMIWNYESGADLVVLGNGRVYGYEPGTGLEKWYVNGFAREPIAVPVAGNGHLYVSVSMQGGRGDAQLDPEPFWSAMLQFDRDDDQRIGRDEINEHFTLPFRPELPVEHHGFGLPLPRDPASRTKRQHELFDWRDKNKDGFWTKDEFTADMSVGHGRPFLAAIRPRGSGDITDSHVTWSLRSGIPEIPSPLFHAGLLYLVRDGGILSCVEAGTGTVLYRERVGAAGQYMASPVIANGHLYLISARGVVTVVKTGNEFRLVHQADLNAPVAATPALDSRSLYIRADDVLLAFR
jgi:outer membrane protein assembly factor BamB